MDTAAKTPTGETYQSSGFGRVRTIEVGAVWVPLLGAETWDQVDVRVPSGSKRVLVLTTDEPIGGTVATPGQEEGSWILDPGVHPRSTNRPSGTTQDFYVAVDPTDSGAGTSPVRLKVMRAG